MVSHHNTQRLVIEGAALSPTTTKTTLVLQSSKTPLRRAPAGGVHGTGIGP